MQILNGEDFTAAINESGLIESFENKAIKEPEAISTLLVNSGLPPKMLNVIEEDLETYFLRVIGN